LPIYEALSDGVDGVILIPFSLKENYSISSSCGSFSHSTVDSNYYDVTNLSVSITVSGERFVMLCLIPDGSNTSYLEHSVSSTDSRCTFRYVRGGTTVAQFSSGEYLASATALAHRKPVTYFSHFDRPTAGTYTYKLQVMLSASSSSVAINNAKLIAKELMF